MAANFPKILYEPPASWGGEYIQDEPTISATIESLRELGDEWRECNLGECEKLTLEAVRSDGQSALYTGHWHTDGYNRNGRYLALIVEPAGDGNYKITDYYDSLDEYNNTKARSQQLTALAAEIAARHGLDPANPAPGGEPDFRDCVRELATLGECHIETARRVFARYMRRARHPQVANSWGGPGRGQGLKPGQAPAVNKKAK